MTGIILKYRVPRRPGEPEREPARRPLQDAQRAVSLIRTRYGGRVEIIQEAAIRDTLNRILQEIEG